MPPIVDIAKCSGCERCWESCPLDVFGFDSVRGISVVLYPAECWHCGVCELECPSGALDVRLPAEVNTILKQTLKDN